MRIFKNLGQALRGLRLNRGNTFLMTLGVMIGIASLTVIVAIGDGIKIKVLNRIANMGFGPESFSVIAGAGRMFFARSKNTTSMTLEDAEDLLALPTVRLVVPRQRKRMQIINKKEFTSTRVYGVTPDWQLARGWRMTDGDFLSDSVWTAGSGWWCWVRLLPANFLKVKTPLAKWCACKITITK